MADTTDLFSRRVIVDATFHGSIKQDQKLPGHDCCFDIYYPQTSQAQAPVVILITGFGDYPRKQETGKGLKDLAPYVSWSELIASKGMAVIKYSCSNPEAQVPALYDYLVANQQQLKLDMSHTGLWSCSGNSPTALHLLRIRPGIRAAAFLYPFLTDLDGFDVVANAAANFRFCNPRGNRNFVASTTPLLVVRAGKDQFEGLNATLDRYVSAVRAADGELELLELDAAVHGFDVIDESQQSRAAITRVLDFFEENLA